MKPTEQTDSAPSFGTPSSLLSAIKFEDSSDNDSVDSEYELFTKASAVTTAFLDELSPNNANDPELDDIKSVSMEKLLTYKEDDIVVKEESEINELVIKDELDISPVVLQPRTIPHSQPSTEGDDVVVKEEPEINELVIKDELDISPVVLQPRTISHSQPSTETQPPGTSVNGDATSAPSEAYNTKDHIPGRKWQIQRTYAKKGKMKSPKPVGHSTVLAHSTLVSKMENQHYEDVCKGLYSANSSLRIDTNTADAVSVQSALVSKVEGQHYENDCEGLYSANSSLRIDTNAADAASNTEGQCEPEQSAYNAYEKSCRKMNLILPTYRKQYKCEYCGYMSSQLSNMDIHMRKHTGDKPYQCKWCDYMTSHISILRSHLRIHRGEKPYQCNLCKYTSSHLFALRTHVLTHTGEKPYQCKQCEYKGSQMAHLRRHITRKHTAKSVKSAGI